MSDIAIRVENYILSRVEGLSKLYRIGRAQQRHDTPSTGLRACPECSEGTGLRDAISDFRLQISDLTNPNRKSAIRRPLGAQGRFLWGLP